MVAKKIQYKDFVKVEFKDSLQKIYDKKEVHMYSVNLACSKAIQVGFDYDYDILDNEHITKTIYLTGYGKAVFIINIMTDVATVSTKSLPVIKDFLAHYEVDSDVPSISD